jgi:transcriptional regulator with XRE-family HTH domain
MDAKELKKSFGRRVRSVRQLRDLTQEQLAEMAKISPEYVGKIERGRASPSFNSIAHLASALEVDPRILFDFSDLGEHPPVEDD